MLRTSMRNFVRMTVLIVVVLLGACPTLIFLLRRTIRDRLRRTRPKKFLNVFQRIHLRFFRACGLASGRTSFASSRTAMSDRLLAGGIGSAAANEPPPNLQKPGVSSRDRVEDCQAKEVTGEYFFHLDVKYT